MNYVKTLLKQCDSIESSVDLKSENMKGDDEIRIAQFDDKFSDFLRGRLSEKQEEAFLNELKSHPNLAERAVLIARLIRQMDKKGKEQDITLVKTFKNVKRKEVERLVANAINRQETKARNRSHWVMWSISMAATLLIFAFVEQQWRISSLGKQYLSYFPKQEFYRGEQDSISAILQPYYKEVEDKENLSQAITMLSNMWNESQAETYNVYTDYMPEIGWLLANAYLRNNQKQAAQQILAQLADEYSVDTSLGQKVRELQAKLRRGF